jgi:glycosyltransferase involved in cell wall biosynthesis
MRIGINFHTNDEYISGVEYYSLGLLNALLHIDTQNDYIAFTNRPCLVRKHVSKSTNLTIVEIKHLRTRAARILWEHTQLPRVAKKHGLDVLHCPTYICPFQTSSVPYVVTIHDTIAIDSPQWCKQSNSLYFGLFMKAAAKKASSIISVSKCTADDLKRNFGLPCSKIRIVYSGIDKIFSPKKDHSQYDGIRKRYNLPERYMLYVGNIEPKKNIWTLLCVQRKLREKGLPHKLVIAGRRSWGAKVELDEISREIRSDNVIWTGYVDRCDLPCVYQMADVFVFLSLYEGFGFPPLEAMACGTPVISTNTGALNETLAGAALTVDPYTTGQITRAVVSMITETCLREKHIRMGLKQSSLFNWERTAKQTLSVYQEVSATIGQRKNI